MCSRAHFSSIVGFRVISIKDLSHLSHLSLSLSLSLPFSLLRYCTEQEELFIFPFQLGSRANWRAGMQHTELDRQF